MLSFVGICTKKIYFFSKFIILEGVKPQKPKMVIIPDIVPMATHISFIGVYGKIGMQKKGSKSA